MMKYILFSLAILFSLSISAQKIELYGGINKNYFYDYSEKEGNFTSEYKPEYGYLIGIGVDSVKIDWITFLFTLDLENYGGASNIYDGGMGGGYREEVNIKKTLISLGIYPLKLNLLKHLYLNAGLVFSILSSEIYNGTASNWKINSNSNTIDIKEKHNKYNSDGYFGAKLRLTYNLKTSNSFSIVPQFSYYHGFYNEFNHSDATKSLRIFLGIGVKKNL